MRVFYRKPVFATLNFHIKRARSGLLKSFKSPLCVRGECTELIEEPKSDSYKRSHHRNSKDSARVAGSDEAFRESEIAPDAAIPRVP